MSSLNARKSNQRREREWEEFREITQHLEESEMIIAFESKCLLLCVELNDELKELELINLLGHEKVKTGFYSIKIKKKTSEMIKKSAINSTK